MRRLRVPRCRLRVTCFGFWVSVTGSGDRVSGCRLRVSSSWLLVLGSGFGSGQILLYAFAVC